MNDVIVKPKEENALTVDTDVAVSIPDRTVCDKDAREAMQRAGHVEVDEMYLRDLETVGIYARQGTLRIQRGRAMINQRRMEQVLEKASDTILAFKIKSGKGKAEDNEVTPGDYSKVLQSFGQLSSKLTESQRFSVECEEVYRPPATVRDPDQTQTSFTPGAKVQPAATQVFAHEVHMHGQTPSGAPKENP